ncbi:MAG TPA: hypothetical protein VHC63_03860 [Acidimicrobiales bacterium]|nr:hypothetical protein [Acidimicrobiales bacterium]
MRVAFAPDLLDRSRFNNVRDIVHVANPAAIDSIAGLGPGDVVAVDLSREGALNAAARAAARGATVYGFASHVDTDTIRAAKADGVLAMARSAFFGRVDELFA